jgi:hypothetical protein
LFVISIKKWSRLTRVLLPSGIIVAIKNKDYEGALSMIYTGQDEDGMSINVNAVDSDGHMALAYASVADQPEIVQALLEAGAELLVYGLPLARLSQRTQAALRVRFCATFASETVHWWMAPRLERIMRCPQPIGELVLGYLGRMQARPEPEAPGCTDAPAFLIRLAPI